MPDSSGPRTSFEIKKLKLDSIKNGQTIASVAIDRVSIEKKKIGFVRFALMREARLENALIKIYASEFPVNTGESDASGNADHADHQPLPLKVDFESLVPQGYLSSMPVKRISGIVCKPVCVEIHYSNDIMTRIHADSATFSRKENQILFKGNVRIVSNHNSLTASKIMFNPEKALFHVDGSYVLETKNIQKKGMRLKTDVFLNPMT